MNHYEVLGVPTDATPAQIKAAYRKLVKEHHTDRETGDHDKMTAITKAYRILKDPEKRDRYDRTGQGEQLDNLEQQAMTMLADGFSQYLEHGNDSEDPIAGLRRGIETKRDEANEFIRMITRDIKKISKRQGKVRRKKAGHDLFASVIETKLQTLHTKIENAQQGLKLMNKAMAILDDYECTEPPKSTTTGSPFDNEYKRMARHGFFREW